MERNFSAASEHKWKDFAPYATLNTHQYVSFFLVIFLLLPFYYSRTTDFCRVIQKDGYSMIQENPSLSSLLLQSRIVFIGDMITSELSNTVVSALLYLDSQSHEPIKLYINSPGGVVSAGFAIIDTMRTIASPVETVCVGMAASMAAVILSCGESGSRSLLKNSEVMIHQPLGNTEGQASDIAIVARHIIKTKEKIYKILSETTGQSLKRIEHDADRNFWMDSEDAVKYGIADRIITK